MKSHASADKPHVIPLKTYLGIGGALLVLTAITIWASQVNLGEWNIVVALFIAGVKATLVAFVFMHLFYDSKLYFTVFVGAIGFLVLFIGFSMIDTMKRGDIYQELARPIKEQAVEYAAPRDSHGVTDHTATDSLVHPDSNSVAPSH